ncbi:hypothetical protein JOC31_001699 [Streptococcus saliviloxodontae]|uniref:Uncharacterized protein n=1 Tax=Streptococcus saliviloxodontae TaxID=1349416 RepID=A0ABS2PNK5_9STRE|nr:hypothetical protein [Streptococcus saliviloxodontae]
MATLVDLTPSVGLTVTDQVCDELFPETSETV